MSYRDYEAARATAAAIFGVPLEAVSHDAIYDVLLGHATPGAAMTLWPVRAVASSISSGPYHVAPGLTGTGRPYTLLAGTGAAYRAAGDDWPAPLPTLVTEGSAPDE